MDVSRFDFDLPDDRIARTPAAERDASRLLVLPRKEGALEHRTFREIGEFLRAGDVLVLNETAVFPARLFAKRSKTGGKVEVFLVDPLDEKGSAFTALVQSKSRPSPGEALLLEGGAAITYEEFLGEGRARVSFGGASGFEIAEAHGHVPLPPYIGDDKPEDRERYQTVFARERGAVAAPTAGLHFTPSLLRDLAAAGVIVSKLVLHVGLGTFLPVRVERVEDHRMHAERYAIPQDTVAALEAARREGRRIVACGTTSVRALESFATSGSRTGSTSIFIYPPHEFRLVDALITNFHLPKSTLLMLVSAFATRERVLAAYREAILKNYRFYSYGDAMLIA